MHQKNFLKVKIPTAINATTPPIIIGKEEPLSSLVRFFLLLSSKSFFN
jgi:hypothetical protein